MEPTIQDKIKAQKKHCDDNNYPHFAPSDGRCYRCKRQIYEKITLDYAANALITGCPFCLWSYCE